MASPLPFPSNPLLVHPQLQAIVEEFRAAQARLHAVARATPAEHWARRVEPGRWSVAECVIHLNLTGAASLPILKRAIEEARRLDRPAPARYRRDPMGWVLWRTMGPPVRRRFRTTAPFIPTATASMEDTISEFDRLQAGQIHRVEQANGLPLGRVRIASPFDPRVRYNLYASLTMLPRHQHRHLWQAERVLERLAGTT